MRNYIATIILACLATLNITAQNNVEQQVIITLSNGEKIVKNVWEVETIEFGNDTNPYKAPAPAEPVDLGLTIKWSTYNLGASKPSEVGVLVGWGDYTAKRTTLNPVFYPSENPPATIVKTEFDPAVNLWGGEWRLPTAKEIAELVRNCTWEWTTVENVSGYMVTSKINNASIFLPVTGSRRGTTIDNCEQGYYWSGSLSQNNTSEAYAMYVAADEYKDSVALNRIIGCAIRPVYGKLGVTVESAMTDKPTSATASIKVKLSGDCENVGRFGVYYSENADQLNGEAGMKAETSTLPENKENIFKLTGLKPNTKYYYVAYAMDGTTEVIGNVNEFVTDMKFAKPQYIDLGLSVKWASWNIGATSEYDYGQYFGWGDPTGELRDFNNAHYAVNNVNDNIGGIKEYDLATAQWGDKWRMPTRAEMKELETLAWTYDSQTINGKNVNGWKITGKNGNYIFIPRSGWKNSTTFHDEGKVATYWTSERLSGEKSHYGILLAGPQIMFQTENKEILFPIRAVYDDSEPPAPEPEESEEAGEGIDLGLSVLWANCNVGATKAEEAGEYFAWGETSTKECYLADNYSHYDKTTGKYTLNGNISNTEYDVAHTRWQGTWRLPTMSETEELARNCKWEWTGTGYKVTGTNGNSIFIPAAGRYKEQLYEDGTTGYFWIGSANDVMTPPDVNGRRMLMNEESKDCYGGTYKFIGLSVRPVKTKK